MKNNLSISFVLTLLTVFLPRAFGDCIKGPSHLYNGTLSTTQNGVTCQRWDTNDPHKVTKFPVDGGKHNYCRNPDKDVRGVWCYTSDPELRWEYCQVPKCDELVFVVWTSFAEADNASLFENIKADPELAFQEGANSDTLFEKILPNSNLRGLATGKSLKEIFFTDIENNYFGVLNTETLNVEKLQEGIVKHIYAISQDWVTGNFYWTDTKMKWVLAADREFGAQIPIYDSKLAEPRAITVLQIQRKLVFSTYVKLSSQIRDTQIIISDLAGNNKKIVFKFPDVTDVTGLAGDEKRIYWTEYLGFSGKVMSSTFEGTDKKEHYVQKMAQFRDIAVYSEYIYVTNSRIRYNYFDDIRYNIDIIRKETSQVYTVTKPNKPYGIAILRDVDEADLSTPINGARKCLKSCGGVCLPSDTSYSCFCSHGYQLQKNTETCLPQLVNDDYILVLDADSGKVYQLSLRQDKNIPYSIAPFGLVNRVGNLAIDLSTGKSYLHDFQSSTIRKGFPNSDTEAVYRGVQNGIKHMQIDPVSNNIFYVDLNNNINVVAHDGSLQRTIVQNKDPKSDIKMLGLDVKQKMIYWTDTHSEEGSGKVKRARYNGKSIEIVMDNLQHPYGLSIDPKTQNLYVMDAEIALLYELRLDKISKKSDTNYQKYDLKDLVSTREFTFTNILAYDGFVYIADEEVQHLLRYDLSSPITGTLTSFGPSIFYRSSAISVYSSTLYDENIAPLSNPCKLATCQKLCLEVARKKVKCINK